MAVRLKRKLRSRRKRYKTARAVLVRQNQVLLAIHSSFWGKSHNRWGLPGGSIEWRETPAEALVRELLEELELYLPTHALADLGAYTYKRALHKVFAAEIEQDINNWDDMELLDLRWFEFDEVTELAQRGDLHAGWEHEALDRARRALGRS